MAKKDDVIKEFQKIKGVGAKKAEQLYDSGFTSYEKLKEASVEDITSVEGFSDNLAEDIKKHVGETKTEEAKKPEKKEEKIEKKEEKKKPEKPKDIKEETKEKSEEEEVEIIEEEEEEKEYQVKKKPELSDDLKKLLNLRNKIKSKTPAFNRQESFRYKRLKKGWHNPRGLHSKMRMNFKYRPDMARIGFRSPKKTRGLHPSGFQEVMVYNLKDIEKVDPKTQAARISGTIGTKKRVKIIKKAEELDVRVLNK